MRAKYSKEKMPVRTVKKGVEVKSNKMQREEPCNKIEESNKILYFIL